MSYLRVARYFGMARTTGPVQQAVSDRTRARVHPAGAREHAPLRRRAVHQALPGVARARERLRQGPAHAFGHRGARDGGDPRRDRAGRRDHHALVHFRLDGQCVRAARRRAGVRRRARGHAEYRRVARSRRPSRPGPRPSSWSTMRASPARWTRSCDIARRHRLLLIEDAAQALGAAYRGRPLGSFGELAAISFHETKNLICGEGGALLLNSQPLIERAEIIREKGTNRTKFFSRRGRQVHVGRRRLVVPSERHPGGIPLGSAGSCRNHRRGAHGAVGTLPRGFAEAEQAGLARRPALPPRGIAQRPHLFPDPARCVGSARASSRPCAATRSMPCSTTYRCTARRPDAGTAERAAAWLSPTR